jgi:hypothetical protein
MSSRPASFILLLSLAACASPQGYPSLAKRTFETPKVTAPPALVSEPASDPALRTRIAARVKQARAGAEAFRASQGAARAAVERSGKDGTESWIAAQLAVSRLESEQAPVRDALASLDEERRRGLPANIEDREALDQALAQVGSIDSEQSAIVQDLIRRLVSR